LDYYGNIILDANKSAAKIISCFGIDKFLSKKL
jgi:hypothetical protein